MDIGFLITFSHGEHGGGDTVTTCFDYDDDDETIVRNARIHLNMTNPKYEYGYVQEPDNLYSITEVKITPVLRMTDLNGYTRYFVLTEVEANVKLGKI